MNPEKTQSRVVYWPETLCLRGEVVGWQQVSSRNARILKSTFTPLRPQHPLDFLKQKCTSCCQTTITTVVLLCSANTTDMVIGEQNEYDGLLIIEQGWKFVMIQQNFCSIVKFFWGGLKFDMCPITQHRYSLTFWWVQKQNVTFKIDFDLAFVYSWLPQRAAAGSWSPETEGWTWGLDVDWFEFLSDTSATLGATDTSSPNYEQKNTGCDERIFFNLICPKHFH